MDSLKTDDLYNSTDKFQNKTPIWGKRLLVIFLLGIIGYGIHIYLFRYTGEYSDFCVSTVRDAIENGYDVPYEADESYCYTLGTGLTILIGYPSLLVLSFVFNGIYASTRKNKNDKRKLPLLIVFIGFFGIGIGIVSLLGLIGMYHSKKEMYDYEEKLEKRTWFCGHFRSGGGSESPV